MSKACITHEPTFWGDSEVPDLRDDPLYEEKLSFVKRNGMVVWPFHTHWHARRPDGILAGWNKAMGWENYAVDGGNFWLEYVLPETNVEDLAKDMQDKLKVRSVRIVGDSKLRVSRVGHGIEACMRVLPKVDILVVFECREWEAAEYVRDAVADGYDKALIQLPHEGGEEVGMDECAPGYKCSSRKFRLNLFHPGDPFWIPVQAE